LRGAVFATQSAAQYRSAFSGYRNFHSATTLSYNHAHCAMKQMNGQSAVQSGQYCPRCGNWLPPDETACRNCARRQHMAVAPRERILLLALAMLLPAFLITGLLSRSYHTGETALSQAWFAQGISALHDGNPARAVEAFRNSLAFHPDDPMTQLKLAQSLIARGRGEEARVYLENLLAGDAGNGPANLELARLASHEKSGEEALRYYHNAIYGRWPEDEAQEPVRVREELSQFLLDHYDIADAEAELISLAAAVPPDDSVSQVRAGQLFLQAGDANRALREFQIVLGAKPGDAQALKGAGTAAMDLGMYSIAQRYLLRAREQAKDDVTIQQALASTQTVMSIDPFEHDLSKAAVMMRTRNAFHSAANRLQDCVNRLPRTNGNLPGDAGLPTASARVSLMAPWTTDAEMLTHPERTADLMGLVFDIEKLTAKECGAPSGMDLSLLELARMPHDDSR